MKKIFSLILSAVLVLTVMFVPMVGTVPSVEASTTTQSSIVIENTFDEEDWNPLANSNLLKEEITDGSNGNALRFNKVTSVTATTGNAIRHYKIFNPEKVAGGYIDYKPSANTTYKLTFRYRTRSLTSYNIFINVRSVANDTVGDLLCRAVTVKKTLDLTANDDYKWDTAVAYFKTPVDAIDALAISVEYNSVADSTGAFNVAIDDVKLETAPSSFVVANTFEEDDTAPPIITDDTTGAATSSALNYGEVNSGFIYKVTTSTHQYYNKYLNVNEEGYSAGKIGSSNSVTGRTNSTLAFRATRKSSETNKVHYEIYDYSQGKDANGKLKSFVPEYGANYRITFDYKVARSTSTDITFTIRPVSVDGSGKRTLGEAIATAVSVPKNDTNHPTPAIWQTATANVPITSAVDGLALTLESGSNVTTYTVLDNVVVHKFDSNVIVNDYEETMLGKGGNATEMASTQIKGGNLFHLGTKTGAVPNTSRVLQFYPIAGNNSIASNTYTYVEIYNPYDASFASFEPEVGKTYKLTFDFMTQVWSNNIEFNVRGVTADVLGEVIANAKTLEPGDTTHTGAYAWGNASTFFTIDKELSALAISIEIDKDDDANAFPYLDNIVLEEVDGEGETTFTVRHSTGGTEKYTTSNLTDISIIEFTKEGYAFGGLYFDAEHTIPAIGIAYGVTDVYAKWYDLSRIENDYEQLSLGTVSNNEANMASTKITGANMYHLGTKTAATPNTSRVLQFRRITGQTDIASGNYTYVEIYNPYDDNFVGFTPKANKYYRLSFDYKVKCDAEGTISFNVRGKTGDTLGDIIETAATVSPDDTYFTDYAWDSASVLINTEGKDYETLAISIETSDAGNDGNNYPYLDNIVLEEVDENGETTFTVHHDSAIYSKSEDVLTKNNLTLFSDVVFEDTNTAKFEGLYFDSEYTKPAIGIVYGTTDVYAKWKDISKFVNTYDASGVALKKLIGEGITFWGKRVTELAPNTSNVIQFNNVYGQNYFNQGKIIHVEIYNPNDRNFTTAEKLPSFKPTKDSVYKISFDYRIKNSATSNISINIRGKKDGKFSDVLGTAVVIESGDPYYSSSIWEKAELYIYTQGVEYDALALTIESDGLTNANLWPYIDNIWVEGVKEYKSGVIDTVAPAENNKNGLLAINNGKWFEVAENDFVNVSFKLDTDTAIPNSRVVANIISDNGDVEEVALFDYSEKSGENLYATTFEAPTSGKVVLSVYKNDNTAVNQEVILSDLDIDTYSLCALKGDSNIDGAIDILDLVYLKESTVTNYTVDSDYRIYADINKNGDLDEADIEGVRKLVLGTFISGSLDVNIDYIFANSGTGSAEGTITFTSNENVDNIVEIYWGVNGQKLDTYNFIGSTRITPDQSVNFELASHFAIPEGATQILINDGLSTKTFDISERYNSAFDPNIIKLVKDYTVEKNVANVKVVYDYNLKNLFTNDNVVSERYDLINEFKSKLSDALNAEVEMVHDYSTLSDDQNYILLGSTKFSESTTIMNNIKGNVDRPNYHADFGIQANGKKIYINAPNDYALQFACDYFLNTYCDNGNTSIDKGISHSSSGELKEITLADVDINSYTVVYPQIATVLEVDAAKYLVANIVKATGKAPLTIANDSKAVGDYEILIGNTNRTDDGTYATTAEATADNSYTITVEEKRTIITGGTNSAVNAAVIDFTDRLMTGALAIGTYSGKYDGKFTLTNGYKLTWSDEFNGTALSSTWQKLELNYPTIAGGKVQWDNTNNTVVENGALKVTAGKIAGTNDITGVSLDTATNKLIKYGYFEARIKSFDQAGYINSFWGSTIGEMASFIDGKTGTYYGEFDILEMYETQGLIKPNLHNHCDGDASSKNYLQGDDGSKPEMSVADIGTKYHNFAMQWTDDYIYFYLDGVKYYSFDCSALSEYEVFDMVTRIRLTFSAGKYVTPTAESDEAYVDWVRVWQRNEAGYVVK